MLFKPLSLHSSLEKNLRLIAMARLVLCIVAQLFVILNVWWLGVDIPLLAAEICLLLLAGSAAWTFFQLYAFQKKPAPQNLEKQVRLQLVSDVLILSLLFHVTGGAANPFVSILLFPLVISASILPGRFNWFMVLLTLSCYGSLFWTDAAGSSQQAATSADPHAIHNLHAISSAQHSAFSLHIIGMWFNFALSAVLISFFVVRMRREIDLQQDKINRQREQLLRDEQLLGIATQAASAAHHIGTPLSTMSVIVHDLQAEPDFPRSYRSELSVLADQIDVCKQVLKRLRHQAETTTEIEPVQRFMAQLVDEFRLLRPKIRLTPQGAAELPESLKIKIDPALRMALLNILNNAADASPEQVHLETIYSPGKLVISITDAGSGFQPEKGFNPTQSVKADGMGLGLFLSHASINRAGGEISVQQAAEGGSRVQIYLPIEE
jgi:two-component system sensor histidine kinase RegB